MSLLQSHERSARTIRVRSPICLFFPVLILRPNSKWFLKAIGPDNLHKMLAGFDNKSIQAVCTFGYSEGPGHEPILFQGRTDVGIACSLLCTRLLTFRRVNLFRRGVTRTSVSFPCSSPVAIPLLMQIRMGFLLRV